MKCRKITTNSDINDFCPSCLQEFNQMSFSVTDPKKVEKPPQSRKSQSLGKADTFKALSKKKKRKSFSVTKNRNMFNLVEGTNKTEIIESIKRAFFCCQLKYTNHLVYSSTCPKILNNAENDEDAVQKLSRQNLDQLKKCK